MSLNVKTHQFSAIWVFWSLRVTPQTKFSDKYHVPKDAADARDNEIKENTNQSSSSPMFQEKETSPNDKRFGATATADTVGD